LIFSIKIFSKLNWVEAVYPIHIITKHLSKFYNNEKLISFLFFLVISRLFQKWCGNGVVSALFCHEIIDFTAFSRILQNVAVADK